MRLRLKRTADDVRTWRGYRGSAYECPQNASASSSGPRWWATGAAHVLLPRRASLEPDLPRPEAGDRRRRPGDDHANGCHSRLLRPCWAKVERVVIVIEQDAPQSRHHHPR